VRAERASKERKPVAQDKGPSLEGEDAASLEDKGPSLEGEDASRSNEGEPRRMKTEVYRS
jgi:hypothetical protein